MDDGRSERSVTGKPSGFAGAEAPLRASRLSSAGRDDAREGDVIQGLRSGLVFSLALWAVLLTVGALVFA